MKPMLPTFASIMVIVSLAIPSTAITQQEQDSEKNNIAEAEMYLKKGKFTQAITALDEIIQTNPQNVIVLNLLGRVYLSARKFQEAESFFTKALDVNANGAETNLGLSITYLFNGNHEKAKPFALIASRSEATRIDALNILGQIAAQANDIDGARKYYQDILVVDSTHYDALSNLGVLYQQAGNETRAVEYFSRAVQLYPENPSAYHNLGVLNSVIGRLHEAIINLNKAASLDSINPKSFRTLGIVYLKERLFGEAIFTFQRALNRDLFDMESRVGKALGYWSLREYDNVLREIEDIRSLGIRFARMELFLANIYFEKKEYDKATEYAKQDEQNNPSQAEGHYMLGMLYQINGEQQLAEKEFNEASMITRQNPKARLLFSADTYFTSGGK